MASNPQCSTYSGVSWQRTRTKHPVEIQLTAQIAVWKICTKMKSVILAALVVVSFAAVVLADTGAFYAPEYVNYEPVVETGVRTKRGIDPASLAFLVGVGAGGIFGPIIYNRLYGWKPVQVGWQEPQQQGWQEPTKGWEEPAKGGY